MDSEFDDFAANRFSKKKIDRDLKEKKKRERDGGDRKKSHSRRA